MVISPLRRKLLRDLRRLWAQVLAIALVLAAGVATLILGNGAYSSLDTTRARYYAEHNFADVFADVTRAPGRLLAEIKDIDGVLDAEARIVKLGLLELPWMVEPGSVLFVSLPGDNGEGLNQLYLRKGRLPDPQSAREVVVSDDFAKAHGLGPGDRLPVLMNGQRRELAITGVALSPEFIYALGPGQMMPDPRRFGIVWAPRASLEAAYDLEGAFSNVVLKLAPGAVTDRVIEDLDRLTARYGGVGASPRADQISHAFLDAELRQLSAMAKVLPPIFLLVAAMLVNMTLSRLITLEREQIGLLKAIGYPSRAVAQHYIEFVVLIAVVGIADRLCRRGLAGDGAGADVCEVLLLPVPGLHPRPAALRAGSGCDPGGGRGRGALCRPVSRAPAPGGGDVAARASRLSSTHGLAAGASAAAADRRDDRAAPYALAVPHPLSMLGVAMAVAILVASLWSFGSINHMIDITFFRSERHDAQVVFGSTRAIQQPSSRCAGCRECWPQSRSARSRRRSAIASLSKKLAIMGRPKEPGLSRVLDPATCGPWRCPRLALILSEALADALKVRPGDLVTVEVLEGARPVVTLPVSGVSLGLCRPWRRHGDRGAEPADGRRGHGLRASASAGRRPARRLLCCRQGHAEHRVDQRDQPDAGPLSPDPGRKHHGDDHCLCRPCRDHRDGRGLQFLAHRAVGTGAGTCQPAGAWLHQRARWRACSLANWPPSSFWRSLWAGGSVMASRLAMVAAFSSDLYRVPFVIGPRGLCHRQPCRLCRRAGLGLCHPGPDQQP